MPKLIKKESNKKNIMFAIIFFAIALIVTVILALI